MKTFSLTLIAASAIALSASVATAQLSQDRSGGKMGSFLSKTDSNGDKAITLGEFQAEATARFNSSDTDGNGYLTEAERDAARDALRETRNTAQFDETDTNGDGFLSRDEVTAKRGDKAESTRGDKTDRSRDGLRDQIKAKVDTNDDGSVDDDERAAAKEAFRSQRSSRNADTDASDTDGTNRRPNRGDRNDRTDRNDRSDRVSLDSNDDDLISLAELHAFVTAQFNKLDTNDDGQLTADDRTQRNNRNGGRRGGR